MILRLFSLLFLLTTFHGFAQEVIHDAKFTDSKPIIDGLGNEGFWADAAWYPMDQKYLGEDFDSLDFQGQFKLAWDNDQLYLLVEVIDDTLVDFYEPWDTVWWDDDCVEIFIDEDNSDGNHQFNHNAFAYHVLLDYNVVDLGPDKKPHLYNEHLSAKRTKSGNTYTWEFAINMYEDSYVDGKKDNVMVKPVLGKKIGFMLAYCDNDKSKRRENFVGSAPISGEDKDRGWIDAGVFGTLHLVK